MSRQITILLMRITLWIGRIAIGQLERDLRELPARLARAERELPRIRADVARYEQKLKEMLEDA